MKSALETLITNYQNEKNTEEILSYATEVVDFYKSAIPNHIKFMSTIKNTILRSILEQEIERAKYFLKEYLLLRTRKISKRMRINMDFLSEKEREFFLQMKEFYIKGDIFVDEEYLCNEVVGFISNLDGKTILLDGKVVTLKEGDFYICSIKDVYDLLCRNEVDLV